MEDLKKNNIEETEEISEAEREENRLASKEEDIIAKLMGGADVPRGSLSIPRLGIKLELKGLLSNEMDRARKSATTKRKIKGVVEEKTDNILYDCALIETATTNFNWNDSRLIDKYKASDSIHLIRSLLLAGERVDAAAKVLELSGFNSDDEMDEEDIKNS